MPTRLLTQMSAIQRGSGKLLCDKSRMKFLMISKAYDYIVSDTHRYSNRINSKNILVVNGWNGDSTKKWSRANISLCTAMCSSLYAHACIYVYTNELINYQEKMLVLWSAAAWIKPQTPSSHTKGFLLMENHILQSLPFVVHSHVFIFDYVSPRIFIKNSL